MTNPMQALGGIFGILRHVARTTLALGVVLLPALLASRSAHAQTFGVLYSFTGGIDGGFPMGNLLLDNLGNLYGTTNRSGSSLCNGIGSGCGTVFKVYISGKETTLTVSPGLAATAHIPRQVWSRIHRATCTAPRSRAARLAAEWYSG